MKTQKVSYLDYEIVNSGNSDGWVITKPQGKLYECNLGNYRTLESAKKDATLYFLAARPEVFARNVVNRMTGDNGTYHEWFLLTGILQAESIAIPPELTCSNDINLSICFNGELLSQPSSELLRLRKACADKDEAIKDAISALNSVNLTKIIDIASELKEHLG
jgi:uncharacterized protein (DUF2461 family)